MDQVFLLNRIPFPLQIILCPTLVELGMNMLAQGLILNVPGTPESHPDQQGCRKPGLIALANQGVFPV
jgi:hypothetical protein